MSTPAAPAVTPVTPAAPAVTPVTPAGTPPGVPATIPPATPPVVTPPPAVIPPTPAQPEPSKAKGQKEAEPTYAPTGDHRIDLAMKVVGEAGILPDHPAILAVTDAGDLSLLAAELAIRGVQGGEQVIALLAEARDADFAKQEATVKAIQDEVVKVAGSPEAWSAAVAWVQTTASEDERNTLNEIMQTPYGARIAGKYIMDLHRQFSGADFQPAATVRPDAPAQSGVPNGPITRRELAVAGRALYTKYGEGYMQTPEYRALAARLVRPA